MCQALCWALKQRSALKLTPVLIVGYKFPRLNFFLLLLMGIAAFPEALHREEWLWPRFKLEGIGCWFLGYEFT